MDLNKLIIFISALSLILYLSCGKISVLFIGFLCVLAISYVKNDKTNSLESFFIPKNSNDHLEKTQPTKENPLMNVMPTDQPKRNKAEDSYLPIVEKDINEKVKDNLDNNIFRDLGDEIELEHSMRQFYSTPNTTIPNDQKSFGNFLYGNMESKKYDNIIACEKI